MKITAATLPVGARFVHAVPAADAVPVRVVSPSRSIVSAAPRAMVNVYAVTLTQGLFGPAGRKVTLCYYADHEVEAEVPERDFAEELRAAIVRIADAREEGSRALEDALVEALDLVEESA